MSLSARIHFPTIIVFIFMGTAACTTPAKVPPAAQTMEPVISLALQGNVAAALKIMPNESELETPKDKELRRGFEQRFVTQSMPKPRTGKKLVDDVIDIYEDYWDQVLLQKLNPDEGERYLYGKLQKLTSHPGAFSDKNLDTVILKLKKKLRALGYYGIYGTTRPYVDLMLWRKETKKEFNVPLHDGTEKVQVVMADGFAVLGWSAYATLGAKYTGGWADRQHLFCVTPKWDLNQEAFQVSFLAHEARHFRDYKLFPKLEQADLEYRGKLTELILAQTSLAKLISAFAAGGNTNRESPHAYANHHIIENLKTELNTNLEDLKKVPPQDVNRAARTLFDKHTAALTAAGASTTKGVL